MIPSVLCALTNTREKIDSELTRIKTYLENASIGSRGKALEGEGIALPDEDHRLILSERQRAARYINDRKRIEYIIECLNMTQQPDSDTNKPLNEQLEELNPFTFIEEVYADSPAETAGLLNGDFIIQFGEAKNLVDLPQQIVEGQPVTVHILRVNNEGRSIIDLTIIPKTWGGHGLIGCHLIPFCELKTC